MQSNFNKILIFFLLAVESNCFSQVYDFKPDWRHFEGLPDTSSVFPGEDLIILKNERVIHNSYIRDFPEHFSNDVLYKYGGIPVTVEENFLQLYIRSDRGARLIWQLQIPVLQQRTLLKINLRTRKPSGKITDLKDEDMRYVLNQTSKTKDFASDYSYLPVPGADAGDIVEIYSSYFIPGALKSDEIYYHQYYPTCKSIFKYDHSSDFRISLMKYNFEKFDYRETRHSDNSFSYTFQNLPGLYSQPGLISHFELPYTVFRIDSIFIHTPAFATYLTLSSPTWSMFLADYIKEWLKVVPAPSPEELSRPGNFFNEFMARYPGTSDYKLATEWHGFLNDSIALRFISEKEGDKPLDYWIDKRTSDRNQLTALYLYFFDYHRIDYTLYLSRDIQSGFLDSSFVYAGQGMTVFFGVNDNGQEHYFFPRYETEVFETDEFPSNIRGAMAVGLKDTETEPEITILQIPFPEKEENWKNRNLYCSISDPSESRVKIYQRSFYNGDIGKAYKVFYDQLFTSSNPLKIMESLMTGEPGNILLESFEFDKDKSATYKQAFNLAYECDNFISKHSDSSFSIKVEDVSALDVYQKLPFKRIYGFYSQVPYSNTTRFYLKFDKSIDMMGHDTISENFTNGFGSMHFIASLTSDKTMMVETYYSVNTDYLPAEEFGYVEDLARKTNEILQKHIFFQLKD